MKKIVGILVCMLVFSTFAAAISSTNTSTKSIDNEPANRAYSHTILGEFGTIANCSPSIYSHWALKNIYYTEWHPFYYVTHVYDKNTHAYQRVKTELGLVASPTVFWDGGYRKDVGASSPSSAMAKYNTSIIQCGNRDVANIDLALDVEWLGAVNPYPENGTTNVSVQSSISWTISEMEINVSVTNNEASLYNGHLHVYVTDINSTMWNDPFGNPYTFAFLDYAFNQNIGISAGSTWQNDVGWDGKDHDTGYGEDFGEITQDNTMVITSVFNPDTNYSDETTGFRAGVGTDPKTFDVYFGNSTPPPKIVENVSFMYFLLEPLEFNTTYYWKVDVWDALGNIIEGEIWSFTTRDNNPPYTPSTPYPPNGTTNASICGNLSWTGGDPDGDNVTYDVYFGEGSGNPPKIADDIEVTWFQLPFSLDFETSYVWKVVAEDEYGVNNSSPLWIFTTEANLPPYEPSNPHPPDGGTNVTVNITLCWEGGDPNPCDTVTYDVYFGITNPPTKKYSNQTGTCYDPVGDLEVFKTYYWRVVAWGSQGLSTSGPIWSFTTGINHPPDAPDIEGPTVKPVPRPLPKQGEPINYTFKSTDPDGHDVYYYIDWGDGSCEDWFGPFESGEEVTRNHTWNEKSTYDIRAKAKDIYGEESDWGYLEIIIPKDKTFNFNFNLLSWLFERFPNAFPIFRFLLGL